MQLRLVVWWPVLNITPRIIIKVMRVITSYYMYVIVCVCGKMRTQKKSC